MEISIFKNNMCTKSTIHIPSGNFSEEINLFRGKILFYVRLIRDEAIQYLEQNKPETGFC